MQQFETDDRCRRCRKEREERAQAKEKRRDEREGLRVPGGTLTWHPAVKNVFFKIGGIFRGKNDSYEEMDEQEVSFPPRKSRSSGRSTNLSSPPSSARTRRESRKQKPTKSAKLGRKVESDEEPIMVERTFSDDELFDERFDFETSSREKGKKKRSPRNSQYGSEQ